MLSRICHMVQSMTLVGFTKTVWPKKGPYTLPLEIDFLHHKPISPVVMDDCRNSNSGGNSDHPAGPGTPFDLSILLQRCQLRMSMTSFWQNNDPQRICLKSQDPGDVTSSSTATTALHARADDGRSAPREERQKSITGKFSRSLESRKPQRKVCYRSWALPARSQQVWRRKGGTSRNGELLSAASQADITEKSCPESHVGPAFRSTKFSNPPCTSPRNALRRLRIRGSTDTDFTRLVKKTPSKEDFLNE